jgi:hypothetical protein
MTANTISLKELASKLAVSEKTIVRHEYIWGLNICRCRHKLKPKLYWLDKVNAQLLRRKVIREPLAPG